MVSAEGCSELKNLKNELETIHLRCWQIFTIFDPTDPHPHFFTTIRRHIWPIFDPFPLKDADVLNGWSFMMIFTLFLYDRTIAVVIT